MIDDGISRIHERIDRVESKVEKNKDDVLGLLAKLTKEVTILVTQWQDNPKIIQPCEFFKEHLKHHKDWKNLIVQWIGSIIVALIILYIGSLLKLK